MNVDSENLAEEVSESKSVIPDLLQNVCENSGSSIPDEIALQNSKNLELTSGSNVGCAELILDDTKDVTYVNVESKVQAEPFYSNCVADHADCVNVRSDKSAEPEYVNSLDVNMDDLEIYDKVDSTENSDVYGALADIRFTGPSDCQLMSTSFSESADLGEEQDWDSGSDTRSSSSAEFVWKVIFCKHDNSVI